jgi:hypothetical protein
MKFHHLMLAATAAVALSTVAAQAGTLENLERERALLLETLLSAEITAGERQEKIAVAKHRLVDLERMVLRDQSLVGRNEPVVRKAFENYDLTFLVHAATEKNAAIVDHWLEQVGVTTHNLMNARVGRR